jgi:hypothetical protein
VIESWKREAKPTYAGGSGYQPVLALWAEMQVVVGDEFRDGNVPAQQGLLGVAQRGFQALPATVTERYFRGDSACEEDSLLSWLRDEKRADGPPGFIGFAVSARMNPSLREAIVAMPAAQWQPYSEDSAAVKECAEVDYVPEESAAHRYREPLRYVAIRIRKKQGELFADGSAVKYFAVLTNLWEWSPTKLLQWHREKAGSIEAVHDVIKNELAGGVMPCGRFGANAACSIMRGKPCCGWVGLGGGFPIGNMPCACCLYPRAAEAPALPQQNKAQSDRRRKGAVSPLCAYRTSAGRRHRSPASPNG